MSGRVSISGNEYAVLPMDGSSGDLELEREIASVMQEYLALWKLKQKSYGPGNIAAFQDAGCVIRAMDKIQRLIRFYFKKQDVTIKDESIEDTWLDLIGYAIMGLMCRRNKWTKTP